MALSRTLVVFVHGFGSSGACWKTLIELLNQEPRIRDRFDLVCYEYPTQWFNFRQLRKIPTLKEIGQGLGAFLNQSQFSAYPELMLVGHSQGGLIIQSWITAKLQEGSGESLDKLRQVLLIATPNRGSQLFSGLRKFASYLTFNPQERSLRVLDPQIDEMMGIISQRVVGAEARGPNAWPIPMHAFWGLQDNVVQEASAKGPFEVTDPLAGDHFTVLKPENRLDGRYTAILEALVNPVGHRAVYEIDLWKSTTRVWPIAQGAYAVQHGTQKRNVVTDNRAEIIQSITFSAQNRCVRPYLMHYLTCNGGYVKSTMSHPNEAPAQEKAVWEMTGMEVRFRFTPDPGVTYVLSSDVLNGFAQGDRSTHSHLDNDIYVKKLRRELDLSAFLKDGWTITQEPKLYFIPHPVESCDHETLPSNVIPPIESGPGRWVWELHNVQVGVVRLQWDVQEPASAGLGAYTGG